MKALYINSQWTLRLPFDYAVPERSRRAGQALSAGN